jgi:F420-0:gamma-glutamyl ligase
MVALGISAVFSDAVKTAEAAVIPLADVDPSSVNVGLSERQRQMRFIDFILVVLSMAV